MRSQQWEDPGWQLMVGREESGVFGVRYDYGSEGRVGVGDFWRRRSRRSKRKKRRRVSLRRRWKREGGDGQAKRT